MFPFLIGFVPYFSCFLSLDRFILRHLSLFFDCHFQGAEEDILAWCNKLIEDTICKFFWVIKSRSGVRLWRPDGFVTCMIDFLYLR